MTRSGRWPWNPPYTRRHFLVLQHLASQQCVAPANQPAPAAYFQAMDVAVQNINVEQACAGAFCGHLCG